MYKFRGMSCQAVRTNKTCFHIVVGHKVNKQKSIAFLNYINEKYLIHRKTTKYLRTNFPRIMQTYVIFFFFFTDSDADLKKIFFNASKDIENKYFWMERLMILKILKKKRIRREVPLWRGKYVKDVMIITAAYFRNKQIINRGECSETDIYVYVYLYICICKFRL